MTKITLTAEAGALLKKIKDFKTQYKDVLDFDENTIAQVTRLNTLESTILPRMLEAIAGLPDTVPDLPGVDVAESESEKIILVRTNYKKLTNKLRDINKLASEIIRPITAAHNVLIQSPKLVLVTKQRAYNQVVSALDDEIGDGVTIPQAYAQNVSLLERTARMEQQAAKFATTLQRLKETLLRNPTAESYAAATLMLQAIQTDYRAAKKSVTDGIQLLDY